MRHGHGHGRTRRALRRFRLGSGPLKRRSDRLEFTGRLLLTLLLLASIPLSVAIGQASATSMSSRAAAEAAERHTVTGTVTTDAPPRSDAENPAPVKATVAYRVQDVPRQSLTLVPPGTKAGTRLTLWVDRRGALTSPPLDPTTVTAQATGIGLGTFCGLITVATAAYLTFRALLDRARLRRWAADWAAVEPRWTGTVR